MHVPGGPALRLLSGGEAASPSAACAATDASTPPLLWLLAGQVVHDDGSRSAPTAMGLFSSPERARATARLHPDLSSRHWRWTDVGWDFGRQAYRTRAESSAGGERERWELWVVPFALDEPVFDYHEDRERFQARLRAHAGLGS